MRDVLVAEDVGLLAGGRWLLRDITHEFAPGHVIALVGPNGAGKSTLLNVLAGDMVPTQGGVHLDGRPIRDYRPRELATRLAVLPQQVMLQFPFTAREVVEMGRHARRGVNDASAVARALSRTETRHLAERTFPSLSVGEQARVSLARVLAQETPILLLDEPTASLDLRHQQLVMRVAREIASTGGTVIVVLHDLNLAAGGADCLVLLREGRLVASGPPAEVLTERRLTDVFEYPISVTAHPLHGGPLVLPGKLL